MSDATDDDQTGEGVSARRHCQLLLLFGAVSVLLLLRPPDAPMGPVSRRSVALPPPTADPLGPQ